MSPTFFPTKNLWKEDSLVKSGDNVLMWHINCFMLQIIHHLTLFQKRKRNCEVVSSYQNFLIWLHLNCPFPNLEVFRSAEFLMIRYPRLKTFWSSYLLITDSRWEDYTHTLQLNVTVSPGLTVRFDIVVESINGSPHVLTETNKNNETFGAEDVLASDKLIISKMSKKNCQR